MAFRRSGCLLRRGEPRISEQVLSQARARALCSTVFAPNPGKRSSSDGKLSQNPRYFHKSVVLLIKPEDKEQAEAAGKPMQPSVAMVALLNGRPIAGK